MHDSPCPFLCLQFSWGPVLLSCPAGALARVNPPFVVAFLSKCNPRHIAKDTRSTIVFAELCFGPFFNKLRVWLSLLCFFVSAMFSDAILLLLSRLGKPMSGQTYPGTFRGVASAAKSQESQNCSITFSLSLFGCGIIDISAMVSLRTFQCPGASLTSSGNDACIAGSHSSVG